MHNNIGVLRRMLLLSGYPDGITTLVVCIDLSGYLDGIMTRCLYRVKMLLFVSACAMTSDCLGLVDQVDYPASAVYSVVRWDNIPNVVHSCEV